MDRPNSNEAPITTQPPVAPSPAENAAAVSAAESWPELQTPLATSTSPVALHTTRVSRNTPSMATLPCRTGSLVRADAWAMGTEPVPASLE